MKLVNSLGQLKQQGGGGGGVAIAGGTQTATAGTVIFSNSNGLSFGLSAGTMTAAAAGLGGTIGASDVYINTLGSPTYDQLQEIHDLTRAAGHLDGGDITDAGGGTIDVAAGSGFLRAVSDDTSTLFTFDWSAATGLTIPTDTIRYVVVEYNAGSPQVAIYTTESYDYRTAFPVGFVVNEGGTLYINNTPHSIGRAVGRLSRRNYEVDGRSRANALGGLIISETGTRNLSVTAGATWLRGVRDAFASFDSSGVDTFDRYYRDGVGGWTAETAQSQIPNDNYDDGSGTLAPLSTNRYGVRWFFLGPANGIIMVYGRQNNANLAAAETEPLPTDLPLRLQVGGLLLGRVIYVKGASSAAAIASAFDQAFIGATITDHGNLGGLGDDDHTQYQLRSEGVINAVSAGGASQSSGQIVFSNSNGVSFGLNASTVTATVQTNYAVSDHSHGNPTLALTNLLGTTASNSAGLTLSLSHNISTAALSDHSHGNPTLALTNLNGTTASNSAGLTLSLSAGNYLTSQSNQAVSAANGSFTFQTVTFSNANGISFGTSAGPAMTASYTVPTVTNSSLTLSDPATSLTIARLALTNLNGVTLTLSTTTGGSATIVGSHNALTSQSNQALSGSNGSFTFQTATFGNSNGLSFYTTNGSIVASYTVPAGGGAALSAGTQSVNTGTVLFADSNGITFGMSASTRITASHNGLTSQSNQALSGSNGSFAFQTATFGNLNGLSFYTSNGSLVGSYTVPAAGETRLTAYAVSNTTQSTSGTIPLSQLSFHGAGIASVGISNGSVLISVPSGGGGLTNINISAGTTSQNLSNVVFGDGGNVSFGLNGSTVTASSPTGGAGITYDRFAPYDESPVGPGAQGQATLHIQPVLMPNVQFDRLVFRMNWTHASNSTGSFTLSQWFGLYTRGSGASTSRMSLFASTSEAAAITFSGTANSSVYNGPRVNTVGWTTTIPGNEYFAGVLVRTTTGGANASYSQYIASQIQSNFSGVWGVGSAASVQRRLGQGAYSVSTTGLPVSIAFSEIRGSNSLVHRPPVWLMLSESA